MRKLKTTVNDLNLAKRSVGWGTFVILVALTLLLLGSALAETAKRLILTDGSYQSVTEWHKEGDRVRYLSSERGEWEEIPAALIDWKATDQWNAETDKSRDEELKQVTGEEVARHKEEMLNTPQVAPDKAPDLRLPADGGVYLLEERAGAPVLQVVQGNKAEENEHEAANRLKRSLIPLATQVQTVELKGMAAKVRVHSPTPVIFVDVDNQEGAIPGEYFRILRLSPKHGVRLVSINKTALGGDQSVKQSLVPAKSEKFSGGWWKLLPAVPLKPGEYAIAIEAPGETPDTLVWDFGVDP